MGPVVDPETGLQYLRARYYDPTTGQFLTRDPANALTRSAYGYVDGNPLNGSDPSGLWRDWVSRNAGAIAAVAAVTAVVAVVVLTAPASIPVLAVGGGALAIGGGAAGAASTASLAVGAGLVAGSMIHAAAEAVGEDDCPKQRRRSSKSLRKEWENETGDEWPQTDEGRNYDVSHDDPLADGGLDGYPNTGPMHPDEHRQMHKDRGDFKRWGGRP